MLCSKFREKDSVELAEEIASLARRLCTKDIDFSSISTLVAARLVPLMKEDNGLRPIGIGEVLRRIIGKSITKVLKEDIQMACGALQTCSGISSGIDSTIHAMKDVFDKEWCEGVLLIDAENAFNRINRKQALSSLSHRCPPLYKYLLNTYRQDPTLFLEDGSSILSKEGVTQGDNAAMAMYGVAIRPLIDELSEICESGELCQTWYADDGSGGGKLAKLKQWFDLLNQRGPKYGFFIKRIKTYLILKDPSLLPLAQQLFHDYGIQISLEGHKHVGAAIGSEGFKEQFVGSKIEGWCKDVEELAKMAEDEPQAALSAFNVGLRSRWSYVQRTISNTARYFDKLEATKERLLYLLLLENPCLM